MTTPIEVQIRDAAARGLSQRHAAELLGINREKFREMCQAIQPPVQWPARNQSIGCKISYESRRGHATEAQMKALQGSWERKSARHARTLDGRTGSIEYLAQFYPVGARTIYRRLKAGKTLEEAVRA